MNQVFEFISTHRNALTTLFILGMIVLAEYDLMATIAVRLSDDDESF